MKIKHYILFILIATMIISLFTSDINFFDNNPKFGLIDIDEPISYSREIVSQLNEFNNDDDILGIILRINTPGGTVAPSQEIYEKVRIISESDSKPIIASMGSIATSGGYYIAIGADTVIANKGTLTGSIGVIMNYPVFIDFLNDYGFEYKTVKSGKLKDSGSSFRSPTLEDSLYFQSVVDNMYNQFVEVLKYERNLNESFVRDIANGQVYTGLQAKDLNLIDILGTFDDSVDLLLELTGNKGKTANIINIENTKYSFFESLFNQISELIPINKMVLFPLPEFKLYYSRY